MKYDDAEYQFLNFSTDQPNETGGTHIGMYLAWAILRDLGGDHFDDVHAKAQIAELKARRTTGCEVLFDRCDGKLTDDDFNELGNAFTAAYYEKYFTRDYERLFQNDFGKTGHDIDDFCAVPDTQENFDRLAELLDQRFRQWQAARSGKSGGNAPPAPAPAPSPSPARAPATPLSLEPTSSSPGTSAPIGRPPTIFELQRRADAGDRNAWYEIAVEYLTGEHVGKDMAKAVAALKRAADLGQVDAQYNLGVAYQNGDGVEKSAKTALDWFSAAADAGHPEGTLMLALAYRNGHLVAQDIGASNALVMLAMSRGAREAARHGIIAGHPYADLVMAMNQPGKLLAALSARRSRHGAAATAAVPGVERQAAGSSAASITRPTASHRPTITGQPRADSDPIGVIATAIGAVTIFVLLTFAIYLSGAPFRIIAYVTAFIGAFGVWRTTARLGDSIAMRIVMTVLAVIPVFGSFPCMVVLYRRLVQPRES